jgi:hypothetical protein
MQEVWDLSFYINKSVSEEKIPSSFPGLKLTENKYMETDQKEANAHIKSKNNSCQP